MLVDPHMMCKISDFGLARDIINCREYESKTKVCRPRPLANKTCARHLYVNRHSTALHTVSALLLSDKEIVLRQDRTNAALLYTNLDMMARQDKLVTALLSSYNVFTTGIKVRSV